MPVLEGFDSWWCCRPLRKSARWTQRNASICTSARHACATSLAALTTTTMIIFKMQKHTCLLPQITSNLQVPFLLLTFCVTETFEVPYTPNSGQILCRTCEGLTTVPSSRVMLFPFCSCENIGPWCGGKHETDWMALDHRAASGERAAPHHSCLSDWRRM